MDKTHKQVGPLSLDELKQQGITRETPVWREGMPNWVQAKDIPELYECITPPKPQISVVQIVLIIRDLRHYSLLTRWQICFGVCRLVV